MRYYLIHFVTYNKLYLVAGGILLSLVILPTKEQVSPATRKAFYLALVIWVICFAYRLNTGESIMNLFKNNDNFEQESQSTILKASPFNKYYSNEAGRKPQNGNH